MTSAEFVQMGQACLDIVRNMAPVDTGNLRYNAIQFEMLDETTFEIFVDESIAPYMPYTNEVWRQKIIKMGNFVPGEVIERMRTWRNPNEGWFDRAARLVALFVAQKVGGTITV